MDLTAIFFLFGALAAGLVTVVYLIAADKQRFLARYDLEQWREGYYLRALPNFLQALYDHRFPSAWPARRNAVSAAIFRLRARPLLKKRAAFLRRAFLRQHITLFALLENLRPYLRDFFLNEQQRIIAQRVVGMEDTVDRDRLIAYLEALRQERAAFSQSLTPVDRATLDAMADRNVIVKLKTAHAIFQEHGYSLLPEFTQLRRWEGLTGVELVQELPVAPRRARPQRQERRPDRRAPEIA
jgi:hypothetical protein